MSQRTDLPLRAEDAVANLKRSREPTSSPDAQKVEKRAKTESNPPSSESNEKRNDRPAVVVGSSQVLDEVSAFERRPLGSVVYIPNKLIARGHELQFNGVLQVKISHQFLSKDSEPLKQRAVWGTDVYTDDTDLVAALHHLGHLGNGTNEQKGDEYKGKDLLVDVLLLPPLQKYTGSLRNNLNSRTWLKRHDGISYMVLGKPKPMSKGWAHSGKELLYARYEALKELREWDPRSIAYV